MQVIFNADTGITIDNAPAELVAACTRWNRINGALHLTTEQSRESVNAILAQNQFGNISYENGTIYVMPNRVVVDGVVAMAAHAGQAAAQALGHTIGEAARPAAALETNMEQANPPGFAPLEDGPTEDPDLEDGGMEEEEDGPEEEEEPIPERTFTPHLEPVVDISDDEIVKRLPPIVSLEEASAVKLYNDKLREYERIWSQAITLKRQIDEMMVSIDESVMMNKVKSDIEYLQEKCDDVESVRFGGGQNQNLLVITTSEIITEDQPLYHRRRVGALRISIDMRYLYAQNPPSTNYAMGIQIMNLDRHPKAGGVYWDCGHVYHEVEDGPMHVCFGGYYQHIFEAFVARDLSMLFDTLMRFVKMPNERDEWGMKIHLFPEVTE